MRIIRIIGFLLMGGVICIKIICNTPTTGLMWLCGIGGNICCFTATVIDYSKSHTKKETIYLIAKMLIIIVVLWFVYPKLRSPYLGKY